MQLLPRPTFAALSVAAALLSAMAAEAAEKLSVTVSHDLAIARPAETISIPWSEVNKALPSALLQKIVVRDAAGRALPYQVTNVAPLAKDPKNIGVSYGELLFQHDFAASEKSATFTVEKSEAVSPPFPVKAFARQITERLDDFAWESDRIAYRTYGPALAAPAPAGAVKEVLITSGIDVWAKRVDYPVVDRWYNKGHDHYHHDEGEGMDFFGVAASRGCGGTGIWSKDRLYVSSNYKSARVVANGPVRAVFELAYDTWAADGVYVSEVKRFTIDAGHNLFAVESTFAATGKEPALTVAVGLTKMPFDKKQNPKEIVTPSTPDATLVQWTATDSLDSLGTAVVLASPADFVGFAEDERNHLVLAKATPGQPLRYLAGAGWTRSGQFPDQAAWLAHVASEAARARAPLKVVYSAANAVARTHPSPADVLQLIEKTADWQLANPGAHKPLSWINGAFYVGLMSLAEVSPEPRYPEAMRRIGRQHDWRLGPRLYHADDHCVGSAYLSLYARDRDPAIIAPLRADFDRILASPKDDNLDFDGKKNPDRLDRWSWCDALFMSPPVWLELARATGDNRYLEFAVSKWWVTSDYLFDKEERLFFRDSAFFTRREANGRKVFWSRGNGWVISGLARMLDQLPPDHPSRPRFEEQFRVLAARILECRPPDGLWRASLLAPDSYSEPEASGSAFFCHAFAWGVNRGLLPRAPYADAALESWSALAGLVSPDGRLTCVQPVGAAPGKFNPDHTEPYGVGALLLAGVEIHRLLQPSPKTAP